MDIPLLVQKLIDQIKKAQESEVMQDVIYLNNQPSKARHEFLFFIKPEITLREKNINLEGILNLMFRKLEEFRFEINDIRILGASYLELFNIIAQHYGVINSMSRNALENLTPEGSAKFREHFGLLPQDAMILGGLEFLEKYKDYDALTLDELWQGSKTIKLAGGTYCAIVTAGTDQVYLINGFHPKQLLHFTEKGRSIITFYLGSDIDWSEARNRFIGKTNPADAASGSLRRELLEKRSELGLEDVNSSKNGFHLSAGPVEALIELMRYCSDYSTGKLKTHRDFDFGRKLDASFTSAEITKICANSYVEYKGSRISTFDLTEEKNTNEALNLLRESSFN